jgi:hypothetical protein
MKTATVERLGSELVAVVERTEKAALAFTPPGDDLAAGQVVDYEWLGGDYEGNAGRCGGQVCRLEIYARGRTLDKAAASLGVEVDDLGVTGL